MEAVIIVAAALIVIVLLEAAYQIALCLLRWAPSLVLALLVGWLAHRHGADPFGAMAVAALMTLLAKRVMLPTLRQHEERRP